MKHIIIAGGGVAAFESAVAARIQDPEAKISMFSREEVLPYRRPGLSALAAGNDAPENSFFIKAATVLLPDDCAGSPLSETITLVVLCFARRVRKIES